MAAVNTTSPLAKYKLVRGGLGVLATHHLHPHSSGEGGRWGQGAFRVSGLTSPSMRPRAPAQVFLGDQSVGKTSIITRFMYDKFDNTYQVRACVRGG